MSAADTHLMNAEAETYPDTTLEDIGDGTIVGDVETELNGEELRVTMKNWEKAEFEDAVDAADPEKLERKWGQVQQHLSNGESEEVNLTENGDKLRGFGGGMLNVVKGEESLKVYGPRRDFGPISHKGMFDISAGRTTADEDLEDWTNAVEENFDIDPEYVSWLETQQESIDSDTEENWEELIHREGVEEVVFTKQGEENTLYLPKFGEENLDFTAQKAALQEFIKAGRDDSSPLNGENFSIEFYDAETRAPEDSAEIILEDFQSEDVEFTAGLIPEAETSSLEGIRFNVINEESLPENYVPQDTENMNAGGNFIHFDRETYEIEFSNDGVQVNIFQSGEQKESYTADEYIQEMDREFQGQLMERTNVDELERLNSLGEDLQESQYGDLEELYNAISDNPEAIADEYGLEEFWSDISDMGEGYDTATELYEDLEAAVELKDELGEEYASQRATVKVVEALHGLEEDHTEYGEALDNFSAKMDSPSTTAENLPWNTTSA